MTIASIGATRLSRLWLSAGLTASITNVIPMTGAGLLILDIDVYFHPTLNARVDLRVDTERPTSVCA